MLYGTPPWVVTIWLAAVSLAGTIPALAGQSNCQLLSNGSFDDFLAGWETSTPVEYSGNALADAIVAIADGSQLPDPLDEQVAAVHAFAAAFGPSVESGLAGSATATAVLERLVRVEGRYLTLRVGGGWEAQWEDAISGSIVARIEVIRPASFDDVLAAHSLTNFNPAPLQCETALAVLAQFGNDPPIVLDLLSNKKGDPPPAEAIVRVSVSVSALADQPCEAAIMEAVLFIDEFRWCEELPGAVPGDATGDGLVNVDDLLAVINAWGPCRVPPEACDADVAPPSGGDGHVNVDDLLLVINNWS